MNADVGTISPYHRGLLALQLAATPYQLGLSKKTEIELKLVKINKNRTVLNRNRKIKKPNFIGSVPVIGSNLTEKPNRTLCLFYVAGMFLLFVD